MDDIENPSMRYVRPTSKLIGIKQAGGDGYFWQHVRAPDGKVFELVCDPAIRDAFGMARQPQDSGQLLR